MMPNSDTHKNNDREKDTMAVDVPWRGVWTRQLVKTEASRK